MAEMTILVTPTEPISTAQIRAIEALPYATENKAPASKTGCTFDDVLIACGPWRSGMLPKRQRALI